jgi:hypothetical protein
VGEGERMLFPGLVIVVLAALSVVGVRRGAGPRATPRPSLWAWHLTLYGAILVLACWMSFGPRVPGPYRVLLPLVPGLDGLRVPARFIVVAALALSVLGSAGAAWLFSRQRPRAALATALALGAAIMVEGYGGPISLEPFRHDQPVRHQLNAWIRSGPPGGVLELPAAGPEFEPFTMVSQYNALRHRHPVVNGYSGYGYALQDFLGGPGSPVNEPDALPGLLQGLRGIGVRVLVLNQPVYAGRPELGWPDPKALADLLDHASGSEGRRFNSAIAWRLAAQHPPPPVDETALRKIEAGGMAVTASAMPDRVRFALDGDLETKWLSAAPQAGGEWLRVAFGRDVDVGRLTVMTSRFGVGDYPRSLVVESETSDGSRAPLFSGSFLPALIRGLASGLAGAPAVLDLPANRSRAIWIRQAGQSDRWQWAVHELLVHERVPGV